MIGRRLPSPQRSQFTVDSSQSYIFSWSISSSLQLTYLGPPFNEKDFSPPRPNTTALSLPSAATRLELWHGLENQARLAQNQKAYSILLAAVRELARSTLCPSLKTSLLHFCTGLDGLLGSISALMTSLGYTLPPPSYDNRYNAEELQYLQMGAGGDRPAALVSQRIYGSRAGSRTESGQKNSQRRSGMRVVRGETDLGGKRRGNEGRRATSGGRRSGGSREKGGGNGRRTTRQAELDIKFFREDSVELWNEEEKGMQEDGQLEQWRRRRLLSFSEGESKMMKVNLNLHMDNQHSYSLNTHHTDTYREEDGFFVQPRRRFVVEEEGQTSSSSSFHQKHRLPRSLPSSTLQPSLSTISLHYDLGGGEEHTFLSQPVPLSLQRGTSLLAPPLTPFLSSTSPSSSLLSVRPQMNDFARKVEGFWILRELQSWLWRSAKDFNRLKKRLRG